MSAAQVVPRLLDEGWTVRVLTRRRASMDDKPWVDRVEVAEGDVARPTTCAGRSRVSTPRGTSCTRWTTSPTSRSATARRRRTSPRRRKAAGVSRIVYLGGLHPDDEVLSPHLASRVEVGRILLDSGVPTAVLQAAVVLGDGSASFDMLRYLTTRLPAMVAPKWLDNKIQPIADRRRRHAARRAPAACPPRSTAPSTSAAPRC